MSKVITAAAANNAEFVEILAFNLFQASVDPSDVRPEDTATVWRDDGETRRGPWRARAKAVLDSMGKNGLKALVLDENRLKGALEALVTRPAEIAYALPT